MATLRQQIEGLNKPTPQDFDPESIEAYGSDDSPSEPAARQHYEDVGPSKLRQPERIELGESYSGSRVRRDDLLSGDDNASDSVTSEDPFGVAVTESDSSGEAGDVQPRIVWGNVPSDEDSEIDSDEAFGEGDAERFQGFTFGRPVAALGSDSGDDIRLESESEASSSVGSSPSDSADSVDSLESGDSGSESKGEGKSSPQIDRERVKALLAKPVPGVSVGQAADAEKGRAVRAQYQTFDRIVDARIKLQKGLVATQELSSLSNDADLVLVSEGVQNAEEAALRLYDTIASIRSAFAESHPATTKSPRGQKRKRTTSTRSTPLSSLFSGMDQSSALPHHRSTLQKWSSKIRASNPLPLSTPQTSKSDSSILDVIDSYIATHHTKPSQSSVSPLVDDPFYVSLLRDLIASRSHTTSSIGSIPLPSAAATRQSKVKNHTRSSKGRKARYGVHEKLRNFMAAEGELVGDDADGGDLEERMGVLGRDGEGKWSQGARGEFFAGLLGRSQGVEEAGNGAVAARDMMDEDEDVDTQRHEGELRLFA